MKNVHLYWIDEHNSSKRNGIGTFRDMLLPRLGAMRGVTLTLISLNADGLDLELKRNESYAEISVPMIADGHWRTHGDLIWPVLSKYIPDRENNVFMLNHSPCGAFVKSLKEMFSKSKITFTIHDQGWCTPLMGDGSALHDIMSGKHCPDSISEETAEYVRDLCKRDREMYDMVDAVVCLSDSTDKVLKEDYRLPTEKVHLIRNGYELTSRRRQNRLSARKELGLRTDEELLIFVGRPAKYKGIEPLLMALEKVRAKHPMMRCLFTGMPGNLDSFWEKAGKIAANIVCIGQVSHEELQKWYAAADVGIMASYSEQCSYAAMEMMAASLTIVASDGNGVRDMFTDGENAMVAKIGAVTDTEGYANELAAAIDRALCTTAHKRRQFAVTNRQLLLDKFSADGMAGFYHALINSVI
ncbi:MAG: glycosyltransferase [Muribaculaceae bacterium]|nr:glycosyltransferase [Muribaculaceae bacterium]